MNRLERFVHARVERHPRLHRSVVRAYQLVLSRLPYRETVPVDLVMHPGLFFGFHDKSPWHVDGDLVLAHRHVPGPSRAGGASIGAGGACVEVGTLDPERPGSFMTLGWTPLWNWQQGSELQWRGSEKEVVFNTVVDGTPVARVVDCDGQPLFDTPRPISAISGLGSRYLAFDFGRLAVGMRGYGYAPLAPDADEEARLLVGSFDSGAESVMFSTGGHGPDGHVFVSHSTFGPGDEHVAFYVRSTARSGQMRTQLWVGDVASARTTRLEVDDCSHYSWLDERQLIAYCKSTERPDWGYHRIDVSANRCTRLEWLDALPDGHPSVALDGRFVVTDTYPDRKRLQRLLLLDLDEQTVTELACLRIPARFRRADRCDFHPRWSPVDERLVCFDSAHSGERALCFTSLPARERSTAATP